MEHVLSFPSEFSERCFCLHGSFSTWKAVEPFLALWGEREGTMAVPSSGLQREMDVDVPVHNTAGTSHSNGDTVPTTDPRISPAPNGTSSL